MFFTSTLMFTLIKKTSVHKDTKVVSNQKYDAILGRIYTISHLLSLERHNRISKTSPFVKVFLVVILRSYGYIYLWSPGIEGTDKTIVASRNVSALLNFAPHLIGSPVKGSRQLCCRGVELKNY